MSATTTIEYQWPNGNKVSDTFTISDDDALRLLDAYKQLFNPPQQRPGGGPHGRQMQQQAADKAPPETEATLHQMSAYLWRQLIANADRYHQQSAAREAAASVPPISSISESR